MSISPTHPESNSASRVSAPIAPGGVSPQPQDAARGIAFARVKPLQIFAAGREHFEALVNTDSPFQAKQALFRELPLEENGWDFDSAQIYLVCRQGSAWRYRLMRA